MEDALACIARIYAYFEMTLSLAREEKNEELSARKTEGKASSSCRRGSRGRLVVVQTLPKFLSGA